MTGCRALVELTRARLIEVTREPEALFWMFVFPVLMALALGVAFPSRTTDTVIAGVVDGPGADAAVAALSAVPGVAGAPAGPPRARRPRLRRAHGADRRRTRHAADLPLRSDPRRRAASRGAWWTTRCSGRAGGATRTRPRDEAVSTPGSRYVDWLVPGLLGMTIMSTGLWGVGFSVVFARSRKLLRRLVATPMRRRDYLLAQALARLVFLAFEAGVLLTRGPAAVRRADGAGRGCWSLGTSILGALAFAAIGLLAASRVQTVEALSGLLNLLILPMWIMSGVFFASSNFPASVQPLVQALPLTALNNALRAVMLEGAGLPGIARDLGVLVAWGVRQLRGRAPDVPVAVTSSGAVMEERMDWPQPHPTVDSLLAQSQTGVYVVQDGRLVYANPRMAAIFGYDLAALFDLPSVLVLVSDADRPRVVEMMNRRLTGQVDAVQYTWRGVRRDGATVDVEVLAHRMEHEGRPAVGGTMVDATERLRRERELVERETRLRSLFESTRDVVFTCDFDGLITSMNPAGERLAVFGAEAPVGRSILDAVDPEVRGRSPEACSAASGPASATAPGRCRS